MGSRAGPERQFTPDPLLGLQAWGLQAAGPQAHRKTCCHEILGNPVPSAKI